MEGQSMQKSVGVGAPEPEADRTVVIERSYDVPARVLFLAHSKPEHVMRWFGPQPYPVTLCEMDFRVGGRFRFAMTGPDGKQGTPFGGEYLDIVPDQRISYSNAFEEEGAETMITTVTFTEKDGRTLLRHHTVFGSMAMKELHMSGGFEQGVSLSLVQLDVVVQAIAAALAKPSS